MTNFNEIIGYPLNRTQDNSPAVSESSLFLWGGVIAFALQIYCDFAGYSDIARGLARCMGYNFPDNFNHPYIATSVRDFWSRWHISLTTWLRDYLYIPLGGNRGGKIRAHVNMWVTMIISGLWHGAAWHYVAWGAIHAVFLSVERVLKWPKRQYRNTLAQFLAWLFVLLQVLVGWVFFRANSIQHAIDILKGMFSFRGELLLGWGFSGTVFILVMVIRGVLVAAGVESKVRINGSWGAFLEMLWYALLVAIIIFFRGNGSEFIYFQF